MQLSTLAAEAGHGTQPWGLIMAPFYQKEAESQSRKRLLKVHEGIHGSHFRKTLSLFGCASWDLGSESM